MPSFLFVLLGAPYMERLRGNRSLSAALTGITAVVVGSSRTSACTSRCTRSSPRPARVLWGPLSLVVPDPGTIRSVAVGIAVVAVVLVFRVKWSVLPVFGVCALLGLTVGLAGLPIA